MSSALRTNPEVAAALAEDRPVVALETAVLTHGLPREGLELPGGCADEAWAAAQPANIETLRMMARAVRRRDAVPAVIGMLEGTLIIGMSDEEIGRLGVDREARKLSTRDLAAAHVERADGGTTVAATLHACGLAPKPIRVFATGGIGGVHRNAREMRDVSADLAQLADSPVCVVCAGAKSILDIPATLEELESRRIAVVGYRSGVFARFVCESDPSLALPVTADSPQQVAALARAQWFDFHHAAAVIVSQPVDSAWAVDSDVYDHAVAEAERDADAGGIAGPGRTPFLLRRVAQLTDGRSLRANIALLRTNADLAAVIAVSMAGGTD